MVSHPENKESIYRTTPTYRSVCATHSGLDRCLIFNNDIYLASRKNSTQSAVTYSNICEQAPMGAGKGSGEPLPLPSPPCRPLALSGFLTVLNPVREPVNKLLKHTAS